MESQPLAQVIKVLVIIYLAKQILCGTTGSILKNPIKSILCLAMDNCKPSPIPI